MENEKIFIVVPVYRAEAYLERCIDSVLSQTYTNWELVLVDDGSPDGSGAICDRYAAEYENITVIHQENGGVSTARNAGVAYSRQHSNPHRDWLVFIDSDDFVHPLYLQYLHQAAAEAGVDVSSCHLERTAAMETEVGAVPEFAYDRITPEIYWSRYGNACVMPVSKLYRLYLFDGITYPVGKIHEDTFTTHKIVFRCPIITDIPLRLYYYYVNPQGITNAEWTPARIMALDAMEEQLAFFREHGYAAAYRPIAKALLWSATKQLMYIHGLSPRYDHLIQEMEHRRSRALRLYAEEVGYPKAIAYWFRVRFVDPTRRVLRNGKVLAALKRKLRKLLFRR